MEVFLGLAAASFVLNGIEAAWGRVKLVDYLRGQGCTVRSTRWRPRWPIRQAKFRIEVERGGQRATGTALVGGEWTGPIWSRAIDFEWDSE